MSKDSNHRISRIARSKLLSAVCLLGSSCFLQADNFPSNLLFVGQGTMDLGNYPGTFLTEGFPAPLSNGPTYPYFVGKKFDINVKASTKGGLDFNYATALTSGGLPLPPPTFVAPSFEDQVTTLLSTKVDHKKKKLVFVSDPSVNFFAGISDLSTATDIVSVVSRLKKGGYKYIVVLNERNLFDIPGSPALPAPKSVYGPLSLGYNPLIHTLLDENFSSVIQLDLFSLFESIFANPSGYGFSNVTDVSPSPTAVDGHLAWVLGTDDITNAGHRIVADYIFATLSAPECYSQLAVQPFATLREQNASLKQQLFPVQTTHRPYTFYPFVIGSYAPQIVAPTKEECSKGTSAENALAGFTYQFGESGVLGVAGGYLFHHYDCKHANTKCDYNLQSGLASVFGGYFQPTYYINGILDFSYLSFGDIERKFSTGPLTHKAKGHTHGEQYGISVYGAYLPYAYKKVFQTGPVGNIDFQQVFVHGYKEKGSDIGNIAYKGQHNADFVTGLGWELKWNYHIYQVKMSTDLTLSANRQWLSSTRHIGFHETSIGGKFAKWPVVAPKSVFGNGNLNFAAEFSNGVIATLGYNVNVGQHQMREQSLAAAVTVPIGNKPPEKKKTSRYRRIGRNPVEKDQ